jgi:hypothetical protein
LPLLRRLDYTAIQMALYEKHFTVDEARAWLPELRRRFERIRGLAADLRSMQVEHDEAQRLIRGNGHSPKAVPYEARVRELQEAVREIVAAGIEVKDVERGLVDFPHWRDGEEVFLCWQLGEEDLGYWHRIEDGYAGRQPL